MENGWRKRRTAVLTGLLALAGLALCLPARALVVERVRMHEAPEHTRVVFEISGSVRYSVARLTGPDRVVVDLENATLASGLDLGKAAKGYERIKGIRTARRGQGQRVVLDTAGVYNPEHFKLDPVPPYGHRLVIDLFETERGQWQPAPLPPGNRDVVIAVDAGHGGEDPGAVGAHGIYEKTVVLQMARKVAALFDKAEGYRAVLIRKGDYYISLRERTEIARKVGAHMFLSIHADAAHSKSASGASVYALSEGGASSEQARQLANKENRSDMVGGSGPIRLDDKEPMLQKTLLNMGLDGNRSSSLKAGDAVLKSLGGVTKLHSSKVGQAGFVVLKLPNVPSLLIETGYISNPREARRLTHADHQHRITKAIHAGVSVYMANDPPPGTLLAERLASGNLRYIVERGDTLSEIAARHGTTVARIRRANGLRGDRIKLGQVILIPARS